MLKSAGGIIGLLIFVFILFGAGILIYRFIVTGNASTAVIVINKDNQFVLDSYSIDNDEVFKIQNNSDKNQTVKKISDKTTLVEVAANSTSRELSLSDNSSVGLYLASNEKETVTVKVGSPKTSDTDSTDESKTDSTTTNNSGSTAGTTTTTENLPNTGPENNLVFVLLALAGFGLYGLSKRILN